MSRFDNVGMWWSDFPVERAREARAVRSVAPPVTNWVPPKSFPNLSAARVLSLDTETKDLELTTRGPGAVRGAAHAVGFSIATEDAAWYFPLRHEYEAELKYNLDVKQTFAWLGEQLRVERPVVGAHLLYDLEVLRAEGLALPKGELFDVQYAEPLIDETARSYALELLAQKYLGLGKQTDQLYKWCAESFGGAADSKQAANIWRSPPSLVGPYAERDAVAPLQVLAHQRRIMAEEGLTDLFRMECGLIPLLLEMRFRGVRIDLERAQTAAKWLRAEAAKAQARLGNVDVWSNDSVARAFDKAHIAYERTEAGNPSFTRAWLEQCPGDLAQAILDVRLFEKAANPFVESYILGNQVNGHIHCQFHPLRSDEYGAVSGRFSSSNPNLQNIPVRHEVIGPMLRSLFIPHDKCRWRRADYSQIEYRLLAHYAVGERADELRSQYNTQPDINFHKMTSAMIMEYTGVELGYKSSKNFNFGMCLIEGSPVLTDRGYMPIEHVTIQHRLWDGVEWVRHRGVVCNGQKETITYDGVTATEDHVVWLEDGRQVPFWKAAHSMGRQKLAVTASAEGPITFTRDKKISKQSEQGRMEHAGSLLPLQQSILASHIQFIAEQIESLFVCTEKKSAGQVLWRTLGICESSLYTLYQSVLQTLRGARHSHEIYAAAIHRLLQKEILNEKHHHAEIAPRQKRQRWTLHSRQHPLRYSFGELHKQAQERYSAFSKNSSTHARSVDSKTQSCSSTSYVRNATAKVYDIVDAGPRSRFTVAGRLVHNCYGMGKDKIMRTLGVELDRAEALYDAYFEALPCVKETFNSAQRLAERRGYIKTLLGRRSRFNEYEENPFRAGMMQRAGARKALNRCLQGGAADILKKAMLTCWREGLFNGDNCPHITVHDELGWSDTGDEAHYRKVQQIMEHCVELKVPLLVDMQTGDNWGTCK